ncbi:hypothetical protein KL942_004641 [Ogataea angusta]|uniref:ABC1 atypical kinase-like domain-containing protein n=1 Tax=Pichia angusta TaxID=870730 RepID=A0AAN6I346_PICAN|nr:uncharacterized protein KL928_005232 [Ogataea angusta]KAG7815893.1 hypothetical protein KL928_005232 [Ogataea angusta]KAG7820633.1 hypothetical protein KL909_004505 [Ogataea angusta]KAG7827022.1 hypothetical protein KL920_005020 [Ogataea angusta]KAG7832559.1 hypothetical protein KL943_004896 [Ogataea angusta]KAG7836723.1 hypothetical protein KL942_004641 [Ogataea angusta]
MLLKNLKIARTGLRWNSSGVQASRSKARASPLTGHYVGFGLLAVTMTGLVYNDDMRQRTVETFLIAERVGVVAIATARCFAMYLKTLNREYDTKEEYYQALSKTHKQAAETTLQALRKNGGIYIKLGQHVSAMSYLLPPEWTNTMVPLQSECPESSLEEIKEMFEHDMNISLDDYFLDFEPKPIGVASLAQVHIATLRENGQKVAVKLQHPSLERFVPLDVELTAMVFNAMKKVFPEYPLTWLSDELRQSIFVELDFRNEAENAKITADYFKDYKSLTALRIPNVHAAKRRILVMEYVSGTRLDDLEYLDKHNISRSDVSSCLSHIFNNMIFQAGFVHCDPHHGNLAIRALPKKKNGHNFEIILYDHGLYRKIPSQMKVDYARFWLAMIERKPDQMQKYGKKFSKIEDESLFPVLAAALTGRDFEHALSGNIATPRSEKEIEVMKRALTDEGVLLDLMALLASVPRIVLLILKTNDLTRHLDEALQNPLGLERTFFIMATYCARAVYADDTARLREKWSIFSVHRLVGSVTALWNLYSRIFLLTLYDVVFYLRELL